MLHTIIKKNSYQDSVNLMLLTNHISALEGVTQASIMMGTPANKDIMRNSGLYTGELEQAGANDMCIVIDAEAQSKLDHILAAVDSFLSDQSVSSGQSAIESVRSWERALKESPDANLAIISVPGQYAAAEAGKALDHGLHAFVFSDNVPVEEELSLKRKAHEKGLLVMGPDCGTGILSGVPLAFANRVTAGNIGIVGASGTGIQEVTTLIDRMGGGISHAIGTGGRDLSETVGAITMLDGICGLAHNDRTEVIVIVSKPPAKAVRDKVVGQLQGLSKPVVTLFLGEKPAAHEGNVYQAYTLEEAAMIAVDLAKGAAVKPLYSLPLEVPEAALNPGQTSIQGLYAGGTLAAEAAMLIADALQLKDGLIHEAGYVLKSNGHAIVDLGDDMYTQGKPHPMIDPATRIQHIEKAAQDPITAVILFDVVLGYGGHDDMASVLAPAIEKAAAKAQTEGRKLYFVAALCGTRQDPQSYEEQKRKFEQAGVLVKESNNQAVRTVLAMMKLGLEEVPKAHRPAATTISEGFSASAAVEALLGGKPSVINVGLQKFTEAITASGAKAIQYDWRPVAGGSVKMQRILSQLNDYRFTN
ncbi:acyl-CoA synthetase FdrA [Paenibacillus sp. OSY-SE]|uniref:acyl-CoA synthetase FdrA n=1 Tax=Paenibacillus sp. OSY-SE TaxID=1196323 RepID=UPI00030F7B17|nr:acyl-CoA synthetase FdrA [Paenibacillus sp. OSY-SE]